MRLFCLMALRRGIFHCSALVSPHGLKNDLYFIVARLFRLIAQRTTVISCVAFVSPHGLKSDGCYMWRALVSPYGSKNDQCYICSALFSRHGFKNDVHFKCSALVSPHGWEIVSRTDLGGVRSTLARTNCLHRIRSSLFANIFDPPGSCSPLRFHCFQLQLVFPCVRWKCPFSFIKNFFCCLYFSS